MIVIQESQSTKLFTTGNGEYRITSSFFYTITFFIIYKYRYNAHWLSVMWVGEQLRKTKYWLFRYKSA